MSPSISVIVPVHNGARYIRDAIKSILSQTLQVAEIIVVDDGSTDGTAGVVSEMTNVRYLRQEQSGQANARNRGYAESSGDLIAFLDADDIWTPQKLELQVKALDCDPPFDCVFGLAVEFRDSPPTADQIELCRKHEAHLPGAMLVRRQMFAAVGPYDAQWRVGEVVDWYARAVDLGRKMTTLQQVVLLRRIHGDNLGGRTQDPVADYLRILRRSINRRRQD
jgi:glycosyltransferase involved in cell wall biosynthesis